MTQPREYQVTDALNNLFVRGETMSIRSSRVKDTEVIDWLLQYKREVLRTSNPPYVATEFCMKTLDNEKQRLIEKIRQIDAFKVKFTPINDIAKAKWERVRSQQEDEANTLNGGSYRRGTNKRSNKKFRKTKSKRH
jgi:hypothetical protein